MAIKCAPIRHSAAEVADLREFGNRTVLSKITRIVEQRSRQRVYTHPSVELEPEDAFMFRTKDGRWLITHSVVEKGDDIRNQRILSDKAHLCVCKELAHIMCGHEVRKEVDEHVRQLWAQAQEPVVENGTSEGEMYREEEVAAWRLACALFYYHVRLGRAHRAPSRYTAKMITELLPPNYTHATLTGEVRDEFEELIGES